MGITARLERRDYRAPFDAYYRNAEQVIEQAALRAVSRGGRMATATLRQQGQAAGLGRLMQAVKDEPDRTVFRRPNGFSVSSTLAIRSGSERTRGAIRSYTEGADIHPVRSRWLWIATDEIARVAKIARPSTGGSPRTARGRLTPGNWAAAGMLSKIGPLVQIRSVNGYPLLVARNVGVSEAGLKRKARSLTKSGRARKGQRLKEFVVAFIGIPRTSRAGRVDARAILRNVASELPRLWAEEMRRGRRG